MRGVPGLETLSSAPISDGNLPSNWSQLFLGLCGPENPRNTPFYRTGTGIDSSNTPGRQNLVSPFSI